MKALRWLVAYARGLTLFGAGFIVGAAFVGLCIGVLLGVLSHGGVIELPGVVVSRG